jgi:hypothetical protein
MVIVHGTEDDLNRAAPILNRRGIQDWRLYDSTQMNSMAPLAGHSHQRAIGFFPRLEEAERAIADLRRADFPLSQVSLVAPRSERRESLAGVHLFDRFDNSRFGFPEERYRFFHNRIARGDYLLIVHGSPEQLRQAEAILTGAHIHDFGIYDASGIAPTSSPQAAVERPLAGDVDPTLRDRDPRIEQPHADVIIVDRRDETRL